MDQKNRTNHPEFLNPVDQHALDRLRGALSPGPVLILAHHNPDPDALASGSGLAYLLRQKWGLTAHNVFSGLIARAENVAMRGYLTPDWKAIDTLNAAPEYRTIALVDTQPGAGNNILPPSRVPEAVFDHHEPFRPPSGEVRYLDLRPEMGSTSTLIFQHLQAAGLEIPHWLSTALFYGLKTDTRGLSRGTSPGDEVAYLALLAQVDHDALLRVEHARRPAAFFQGLMEGLAKAMVYGTAVVAELGEMHRSDFAAELADELITLESARGVLCLGHHAGVLQLSVRTVPMGEDAGLLIQGLVNDVGKGGGHGTIAGGQVALGDRDPAPLVSTIVSRFLDLMGEKDTPGTFLIH